MSKREMLRKRVASQRLKSLGKNESDIEQRRTTRMASIIAIFAIVGTLCGFLYKIALNAVDVLPKTGVVYWYIIVLSCFALAAGVITFWEILQYIIKDLKRYNVHDKLYRHYDEISDERYLWLIDCFERRIIWLVILLGVFIPISAFYENKGDRWTSIVATIEIFVFCLIYVALWIKKTTKEEKIKGIKQCFFSITRWCLAAILCFMFLLITIISSEATIQIEYVGSGEVIVKNESSYEYNGMNISIRDNEGLIICEVDPTISDLLWAKENIYVKSGEDEENSAEGLVVSGERLHWNFIYNISQELNENEKYIVSITVLLDQKYIIIQNEFMVKEGQFFFAEEKIVKEY